jgi:hypothetical protein
MHIYISKICSKDIICSIDIQHSHGHAAYRSSGEMQLGNTAWTGSLYIMHGHAAWRSCMDTARKCSFEMHLGHAAKRCIPGNAIWTQHEHAARPCSVDIQQTCSRSIQHGHEAWI